MHERGDELGFPELVELKARFPLSVVIAGHKESGKSFIYFVFIYKSCCTSFKNFELCWCKIS